MKKIRVVTVGSNLAQKIFEGASCPETVEVTGRFLWMSPFSVVEDANASVPQCHGHPSLEMDVGKTFFERLSKEEADYLVLDVNAALYPLFWLDGTLYTKNNFLQASAFFQQASGGRVSTPGKLGMEELNRRIRLFAKEVLARFAPQRIVLIKSPGASFYFVNRFFKPMRQTRENENQFLDHIERLVAEALGCHVVDIVKYYFADKNSNAGVLQANAYEAELYGDLCTQLLQLFAEQPISPVVCSTPDYAGILRRYLRAYDNIHFRNCAGLFLKKENPVDQLVLWLSPKLIESHAAALVKMNAEGYETLEQAVKRFDFTGHMQLRDALRAILALQDGRYTEPDIPYMLVLQSDVPFAAQMQRKISDFFEARGILQPAELEIDELSYWFGVMQQILQDESPPSADMLQEIHRGTRKTRVDVWGSCISRELFNRPSPDVKLSTYLFRNSILHAFSPPIPTDETLFADAADFFNSNWRLRSVRSELLRHAPEQLAKSRGRWLVMDLYDLVEPTYCYRGGTFILEGAMKQSGFFHKIQAECTAIPPRETDEAQIAAALNRAADFLNRRYAGRIIFVRTVFQPYYVDYSGKIQNIGMGLNPLRNTAFVRKWEDYFLTRIACHVIGYTGRFLADEDCPFADTSPVHYEAAFYDEALATVEQIIAAQPAPQEYTHYRAETKVARLQRLISHNREHPSIYPALYDNDIDALVFRLADADITRFADVLVEIYRSGYTCAAQMMAQFAFAGERAQALKERLFTCGI